VGYLIKKNPFYKTFPAALPILTIIFLTVLYKMIKHSSITNRIVKQILMDPSG